MFAPKKENPARLAERFLNRTCISILLLALVYGLDMAGYFAGEAVQNVLDPIRVALSVIVVINLLPVYVRYIGMRRKTDCQAEDGYIVEKFRHAVVHAFTATFVMMILVEALTEKYFAGVPTKVFMNGLLALALLTLSISFFLNTREGGDEADDDEFGAGDAA